MIYFENKKGSELLASSQSLLKIYSSSFWLSAIAARWLCFLLFIFSCLPSRPLSFCLIFLLISFLRALASAEIFFFSCFLFFTASSSLSGFHFKSQLPHVYFHVTSSSSSSKSPLVAQMQKLLPAFVHKLLGVSIVNISVEFPQLVSPSSLAMCQDLSPPLPLRAFLGFPPLLFPSVTARRAPKRRSVITICFMSL